MPVKKFAISIPEAVMHEVDVAAKAKKLTRSAFISDVLRRVARARSDAEITRRIDELLSDPELAEEQRQTAAAFRRLRPFEGSEW